MEKKTRVAATATREGRRKRAARRRGEPGHQAAERDADERRPGQGEPEGLNLAEQRKEGSCEHDQQAGDCGEAEDPARDLSSDLVGEGDGAEGQ